MKNGKKILFLSIFLLSILLGRFTIVHADDCDNIPSDKENIDKKIECLAGKVSQLSSQAKTLKGQVAQFDAQIKLTTLKIEDTESKIELLGGRIDQLEVSLNDLSKAFASRAVETYKLSKFENGFFFVLSAKDVDDAVSRYHYLQKIQEEDGSLLGRLQEAQTTYQGQKTDQETLQSQLKTQQANLTAQKTAKNNLLSVTKSDEAKYQNLLAQANAQLAKFKNFVNSRGGSSILDNQTKCNDGWTGCYYNQRDSQWGNMFLGGTSYLMKDSGCFVTSIAMMASHNGKNIKPNDIASLPAVFTNQGDLRWSPFSINGVSVSISSDSSSKLDQYLSSGPVIVQLYSGQHFIVILRKDGDNYIMNDPFLPDGYNKPLSAGGYTTSSITSLRLVNFN